MIKARGQTGDGRPLVILGLSGENITRLMAHEPISFDLAELGLPNCAIAIVGGRTEQDITAELEQHGLLPPGTAEKFGNPQPGEPKRYRRPPT